MSNNFNSNDIKRQFEQLLKDFDFNTVHNMMKQLNWQWATCGGVPTVDELEQAARELFADAVFDCFCNNKNNITISMGGLEFSIENNGDDIYMDLKFIPVRSELSTADEEVI